MALARRATPPPPPPPPAESVNFGSLGFYSGGGLGLPEGDYAVAYTVEMFQPTKKDGTTVGEPFLCVMGEFHPLTGGDPVQHPISMGQKAKLSFVPNDTGKGLVAIPGGPAANLNDSTNWGMYLKSLYDSGLPEGIFTNDLSVLDGMHVHTQNIPEPESRKQFRSQTGEAAMSGGQPERTRMVPVVTEIKEDGKPWEGTGGLPEAEPAAPVAKAAARVAPKAAPVARKAAPVAVVEPSAEVGEDDIKDAATNGVVDVLQRDEFQNGTTKLKLRTNTFAAVKKAFGKELGDDMGNAVLETYFTSDANLNVILGPLGYKIQGGNVVVA